MLRKNKSNGNIFVGQDKEFHEFKHVLKILFEQADKISKLENLTENLSMRLRDLEYSHHRTQLDRVVDTYYTPQQQLSLSQLSPPMLSPTLSSPPKLSSPTTLSPDHQWSMMEKPERKRRVGFQLSQ